METPEAMKWWSELSINEQKQHIANHPFFSKMSGDYFGLHKSSITQVYEHYKTLNNLL
jgi:pyrroloquinoline quinone (PQQ) biosynthesis protein C